MARAKLDEIIGQTIGCMMIDDAKAEIVRKCRRTVCYGHCVNCGAKMKKSLDDLKRFRPTYCKNCPTEFRRRNSAIDLSGADFPAFKVIERTGDFEGPNTKWKCVCKVCGQDCIIEQQYLGEYTSCGCRKMVFSEKGIERTKTVYAYNGTSITGITPRRSVNSNSLTGINGVSRGSSKQYRAYIGFQRAKHNLGEYDNIQDAINARRQAEEEYFEPTIENWEAEGNVLGPKLSKKKIRRATNVYELDGRFFVYFRWNNIKIKLGMFDTLEDAIEARDKARAERGMKPLENKGGETKRGIEQC